MVPSLFGQEFIKITNAIRRQLYNDRSVIDDPERHPTTTQEWFLAYIANESENRDVFQKDLEAQFNIRRSTATEILQAMERKKLIIREPVPYDKRSKKITLTQQAWKIHNANVDRIKSIENRLVQGFSAEEMERLISYLRRIQKNME